LNLETNQHRALEAKQDALGLLTAAATLGEVIKQPTKAQMIGLMQACVLDFGRSMADKAGQSEQLKKSGGDAQQIEKIDTEGITDSAVVSVLNRILAKAQPH
jgi:hypothetical protein